MGTTAESLELRFRLYLFLHHVEDLTEVHKQGSNKFSNILTSWASPFEIYPSLWYFGWIYHRGRRDFMWTCPVGTVGYIIWNLYSLCKPYSKIFHMERLYYKWISMLSYLAAIPGWYFLISSVLQEKSFCSPGIRNSSSLNSERIWQNIKKSCDIVIMNICIFTTEIIDFVCMCIGLFVSSHFEVRSWNLA